MARGTKGKAVVTNTVTHAGAAAAIKAEVGEQETREGVLGLLSDAEVASVSTAETAASLVDGDEYLDLERLDQGVTRALAAPTPMGRVLPRKAVQAATWDRILAKLEAGRAAAPPAA